MLQFTSALYLGLRHASHVLRPWSQLTTGAPAALTVPPSAVAAARELAALQGCESATLGTSTLHLFSDLGEIFAALRSAIFIDAGAYPVAMWGMERAAARGTPVRRFAHHDADALWCLLRSHRGKLRPVVVSDGFCPGCGMPAPLAAYQEMAARAGGWLVIDDTQALGILGHSPGASRPYGEGGGGMPRWSNISGPHLVVVASLAKAFGAPLAALSGSAAFVRQFEAQSETRVHCSPPSLAAIRAMERALTLNRACGDGLRLCLVRLVRYFRTRLRGAGLAPTGGLFPVQTLVPVHGLDARAIHGGLLRAGVSAVLLRRNEKQSARISFLINAHHTFEDLDKAAHALAETATKESSAEIHQDHEHDLYIRD